MDAEKNVQLDHRWTDLAARSSEEYIRHAPEMWHSWLDIPPSHRWVHDSAESLEPRVNASRPDEAARAITLSIMEDFEAYSYMQACKVHDLMAGVVTSLNGTNAVAAAASARAGLEAAVALAVMVSRADDAFHDGGGDANKTLVNLADLNDRLERAIWGGRAEYRKIESVNFLTHLDAFVKTTTDPISKARLRPVYADLCDIVHPSATGHQIYWSSPVAEQPHGPFLVELAHGKGTLLGAAVVHTVLWALGWSTYRAAIAYRAARNLAAFWREQ